MTSPLLSVSTPNGRFYGHPTMEDVLVPSVTNIIGMKDKPALKAWAAKMAAFCAVDDFDIIRAFMDKGEEGKKSAIAHIKGAPWRSSSTAASRGDAVHDWVDQYIKARLRDEQWQPSEDEVKAAGKSAKGMWRQFGGFVKTYSPQWIASEFTVWSEENSYAGTGDFIAVIRGKTVYGDTKTGNGVYPEVAMQVAAQIWADYYFNDESVKCELPHADAGAVFHLRPQFCRLSPLRHLDEAYKSFLGLRACFEWDARFAESTIVQAPQIKVTA